MAHPKSAPGLTSKEIAVTRQLVKSEGAKTAARKLGLHSEQTVRKAACGEIVHPLTVQTIRSHLTRLL